MDKRMYAKLIPNVLIGLFVAMLLLGSLSLPERYIVTLIMGLMFAPLFFVFRDKIKVLLALYIFFLPFNPGLRILSIKVIGVDLPFHLFLYLTDIILIILGSSVWINRIMCHQTSINFCSLRKIVLPLILFFLAGSLSLLYASNLMLGIIALVNIARPIISLLILLAVLKDSRDVKFVSTCLLWTLLFQGVLAIIQYFSGSIIVSPNTVGYGLDIVGYYFRPGGTLGHSSHYAKFTGMLLPIALAIGITSKNSKLKMLGWSSWMFGSLGLMLTVSRIGLATWFISSAIVLIILNGFKAIKRISNIRYIFFIVSVILLMVFIGGEHLIDRMQYDYTSTEVRLPMFRLALKIIRANPILGVGLNNYAIISPFYDTSGITKELPTNVHNVYLLYCAETGIFGLFFFIWFFWRLIKGCWRNIKWNSFNDDSSVFVGMIAGIISILLQNLTGMGFTQNVAHFSLVAIFALCIEKQLTINEDILAR